ncbi:protein YLS7 [Pyrus ussuriensis x Pyrus communis]|uniref:Protein YLS7 n=1 Tax=Pyrus ussuriensis x Pyrus communis TaxID=2448454 RepID=A0A5N5F6D0_9ROSA|nr:protein YLS7 [Pyrus ussuriensis x Pyrus communis]
MGQSHSTYFDGITTNQRALYMLQDLLLPVVSIKDLLEEAELKVGIFLIWKENEELGFLL